MDFVFSVSYRLWGSEVAQITTSLLLGGEFLPREESPSNGWNPVSLLTYWESGFWPETSPQLCISFRRSGTYFLENISVFHFQPISHYLILAIHLGQVTLEILLLQKIFQLTYKSMTSPSGSNKAIKCWMTQCQYCLDYAFFTAKVMDLRSIEILRVVLNSLHDPLLICLRWHCLRLSIIEVWHSILVLVLWSMCWALSIQ